MIMANNLKRQYDLHATEYEEKALEILRSGWYILGNEVKNFENEWAKYIGTEYCVGLASGLDALWMSFKVLGIGEGDEVIVSGNAYIACVMGITINGAKPIFVEPDMYDNIDADKIEEVITPKTKAILAVHLVLCQDLVQVKMSFSHSNLPAIPKLPVDTIFQNHRVTYNRNDYEFVWYYKTFPSIQIPDGMLVCNC